MNMQRERKEIYVVICCWKDMAIMQEDIVKFGVRTRKRNKSIKESAKLVSMCCSQFYIYIIVVFYDTIVPLSPSSECFSQYF